MPDTTANRAPDEASADNALLSALLTSEVPARHSQLRPAHLRSATQQQRIALRGFRLRNWVDQTLVVLERGLVVAALIAFGYWLVDGPVRDWFYMRQSERIVWAGSRAATATPALRVPGAASSNPPSVVAAAPSLPFTRPEDAGAAIPAAPPSGTLRDAFLVPQAVPGVPVNADPRPVRLIMPSIGADMAVREIFVVNGEWEVAEYAAGFHNGSAFPGNVGNSVLSGHAGLRGAVFRDLGRLRPGDDVVVETSSWRYVYRVRGAMSVWPTQIEVMAPTPTPVLTLITCTNWDTQRLVVVADLVDARPLS